MKLKEIIDKLNLKRAFVNDENIEIEIGYCCDLLSEVIGKAEPDCIWITVHNNMNVLGVATMIDIPVVVISEGYKADVNFLNKAKEEGISVLESDDNNFVIAGKLYELGIR